MFPPTQWLSNKSRAIIDGYNQDQCLDQCVCPCGASIAGIAGQLQLCNRKVWWACL